MTHDKKMQLLERCSWPKVEPRYAEALRAAVEFVLGSFEPVGIVAAGTIIRGEADASSDWDLFVIHETPFRQRLQRRFHGVPAEIFVNPPRAIREYFASEFCEARQSTAHMFATGHVLLGAPIVDTLIAEAREWLAKPSPPTAREDVWQRYAVAGLLEDAQDIVERDPTMASALLGEAVLGMLRYHLRAKNGAIPRNKAIFREIERTDPALSANVRRFYESTLVQERLAAAFAIADQCIKARGFFEWDSEPEQFSLTQPPQVLT